MSSFQTESTVNAWAAMSTTMSVVPARPVVVPPTGGAARTVAVGADGAIATDGGADGTTATDGGADGAPATTVNGGTPIGARDWPGTELPVNTNV